MKKREVEDFVRDILDSINAIEEFVKDYSFADFRSCPRFTEQAL